MRVPSLAETRVHLAQMRHRLVSCGGDGPDGEQAPYVLVDWEGTVWPLEGKALYAHDGETHHTQAFGSMLEFWAYWLEEVARILTDDDLIERFIKAYEKSSGAKRDRVLEDIHKLGWDDASELAATIRYLRTFKPCNPDRLPRNWKSRLKKNLHGTYPKAWASTLVFIMKDRDPDLAKKLESPAARRANTEQEAREKNQAGRPAGLPSLDCVARLSEGMLQA